MDRDPNAVRVWTTEPGVNPCVPNAILDATPLSARLVIYNFAAPAAELWMPLTPTGPVAQFLDKVRGG